MQQASQIVKYKGTRNADSWSLIGQISASLTSFSRTVDDYSASSKKELIPAKQEKAFERVKKFRTELADYRLQFDRLRKEREEAVSFESSPYGWLPSILTSFVIANIYKPQRTSRPSPTPCINAGKSIRTAILTGPIFTPFRKIKPIRPRRPQLRRLTLGI